MITIKKLNKASDMLSISAILKQAFDQSKDISRVRQKLLRGSPELTEYERSKISSALDDRGIKL